MTRLTCVRLCIVAAVILRPDFSVAESGRRLLSEGIQLFHRAEFSRSISLLERVPKVTRDVDTRAQADLYLGLNFAVMGDKAAASQSFHRALLLKPTLSLDPKRLRQDIVMLFEAQRQRMLGRLTVTSNLDASQVEIDGRRMGQTPLTVDLPVGEHIVVVSTADSRLSERQRITIAYQRSHVFAANLSRGQSVITLRSEPTGVQVHIDGRFVGHTPVEKYVLPPGSHRVRFSVEGRSSESTLVELDAGDSKTIYRRLLMVSQTKATELGEKPTRWWQGKPWMWSAAGSSIAAFAVATGLGISAQLDYNEYRKESTPPERLDSLRDSIRSKSLGSNILFGVGGALAVGALVLYFVEN